MTFMIYDLIIALLLIGYNSVEIIRKVIFRKPSFLALIGLTIPISLAFGVYLVVKNGLIIDYFSDSDILRNWAGPMWFIGIICIVQAAVYLIDFIIDELRRYLSNK